MDPEDVGRILDEIGNRIGPAGEYAWQLTVKQVVIDSVLWGIFGIFLTLLAIGTFIWILLHDRRMTDSRSEFGTGNAVMLLLWTFIPGFLVVAWVGTMIFNPEYHAMLRLIDKLVPGQ